MLKYSIAKLLQTIRASLCNFLFLIKSFWTLKFPTTTKTFVGWVLKKELKILHILLAARDDDIMLLKVQGCFLLWSNSTKGPSCISKTKAAELKLCWLTSLLRPNPFLIHLQTYVHWESTQDPVEKQIVGDFLYIQTSQTRTQSTLQIRLVKIKKVDGENDSMRGGQNHSANFFALLFSPFFPRHLLCSQSFVCILLLEKGNWSSSGRLTGVRGKVLKSIWHLSAWIFYHASTIINFANATGKCIMFRRFFAKW